MKQGWLQRKFVFAAFVFAGASIPSIAHAGYFEISGGFYFTKSTYSDTDFNWVRRYGANAGYHFWDMSEIEFTYQDVTDRTVLTGFEDTTFHDQIYGIDWNQALTPKSFPVQPYVKLGVGELNRTASGSYSGGAAPPAVLDQATMILGAGIRVYLTKNFGLRAEAISYITAGGLATYKQNVSTTIGVSIYY